MGRAIFTQADRVVGKDKNATQFHEGCHAQRIATVIREGQEGAAKRNVATMQCHTIHDGAHTKLAHTVIDVVTPLIGAHGFACAPIG